MSSPCEFRSLPALRPGSWGALQTKGSVLAFYELNCPRFPGETMSVMEALRLNNFRLRRDPHQPYCAWAVWVG
jgi:hypothetical protein